MNGRLTPAAFRKRKTTLIRSLAESFACRRDAFCLLLVISNKHRCGPLSIQLAPEKSFLFLTYRLAPIYSVYKDETGARRPFIQMSKILQSFPQLFASASNTRFYGPDIDVEGGRDLFVSEPLDVAKHNRLAINIRQIHQG